MASENERLSVAVMAEDAADRAKRLILALYQYENILGAEVVANAVADGARLGLIDDAVAGQLTTMSRSDADMYVSAAASGAVAAVLQAMANSLSEIGIKTNHGSFTAHRVKHDEINVAAATGIQRNNSLFSYFILAFSVVMAIVSVFVVVFRAV